VHEAVHLADRVLVLDNGNFTYEVTIDKTADINEAKYADFATGILEKLS
jgi:ABC-type nitrate/sulfonate/bicarbonate transport system ATPase subunit